MELSLNSINSVSDQIGHMNELSKTKGGREVLKNVTKAQFLRLWDRTKLSKDLSIMDEFSAKFNDIVRPNKFEIDFTLNQKIDNKEEVNLIGQKDFPCTYLIKSFNVPAIKTNKISFKRCGKTINIPLNMTMDDAPVELTFYQDANNAVLMNLFTLLNTNEYQYNNQFIETDVSLSLRYEVNFNYGNGSSSNLLKKLANFFGIGFFNTYEDSGDKSKHIEKILTNNYNNKIFEFKFNKIFISNIDGFEWDMEKIDTYAEIRVSVDFNGFSFDVWDADTLMKSQETPEDENAKNIITDNITNELI